MMRQTTCSRKKLTSTTRLSYAEKSIENEDRFDNEITKSKVLAAMGRQSEAAAAQKKALDIATPLSSSSIRSRIDGCKTQR